ncbi:MAG: nitronate monooxygenase [Alphaproteobacteria bacterium]|nr:nitronate monooxygenase [Alphaproteobacteria bacterium]
MSLKTPLCDLLGVEHPVMLAGMSGVAFADVCAAVSEAGGFGTLGMAAVEPEGIRAQMRRVKELTDKPFGVDLLAAVPDTLTAAVDIIIEEGAKAFISGLGVPTPILEKLKSNGVLVISMCGAVRHAVKAEQAGVDIVVAQGTEGGGHTGQVAGYALIPQVVEAVSIPVVAAGSIVDGRGLAASLAFGAQGVWMGTRFIASEEAHAAPEYKQSIVGAKDQDTIVTRCYSGKPMRVVKNEYVMGWEERPEDIRPFGEQGKISAQEGVMKGLIGDLSSFDPSRDATAAGQGVGGIFDVLPAGDIVKNTVAEAEAAIERLKAIKSGSYAAAPQQGRRKQAAE